MKSNPQVTLVICDGLGLSPELKGNAFANAKTPTFDYLLANYPSLSLLAAGTEVGLDEGEPGNSEVGHLTIGTGQVLPQAFQIINGAIKSELYKTNEAFLKIFNEVKHNNSTLHFVAMVSKGGVHGHLDHLLAFLAFAHEQKVTKVVVHAITDGRDTPAKVASDDIKAVQKALKDFEVGVIGSVAGRYYAMDRDNNWDRTDAAYWAIMGKAKWQAKDADEAIMMAYKRGENDETLQPTTMVTNEGEPVGVIRAGDGVIFTNYRPDRIRQLATRVMGITQLISILTLTDYFFDALPDVGRPESHVYNAYPLPKPKGTLAQALSKAGKSQLHIAETEKYAHVTYFFDGHQESKGTHESWLLVPSQKVDSFARTPDMSATKITAAYTNALAHQSIDFVAVNYANADMVGHTGDYNATVKAIECLDDQLKQLVAEAETSNRWLLLTADHGNAEQMIDPLTGEKDKEHTTNPVPFLIVHPTLKRERGGNKQQLALLAQVGMLADVAPTILGIFEINPPAEMVGSSLLDQLHA